MHAILDTPFEHLRWTAQDIADAVPLRLSALQLFDAGDDGAVAANANRQRLRIAHGFRAIEPLPARFGVR